MNLMPGIESTSSALQAERLRMDIIGQNIANAHTTKGPNGQPYQRQTVQFEAKIIELGRDQSGQMRTAQGVNVRKIGVDETEGALIYNPGHPDADKDGNVRMPNVNLTHEMVDLISASRTYEANLQVVRTSKQMAQQALRIGQK